MRRRTYDEALDALVERIRVASSEAPRAGSHSGPEDLEGEWFFHYEDEGDDGYRNVRPVFAFVLDSGRRPGDG